MIEVDLEEFEDFYEEKLNSKFFKVKRIVGKYITEVKENLIEIKVCMDHFIEEGKEKIDEKAQKSLYFFSERIRKEIDEIEVPEDELSFDNITTLINSVKKLFTSINEIARKALPKFKKQVQPQIKELNYLVRKLQKKQAILEDFMRKKYTELKDAEYLLKKLPKIVSLKENIEHAKRDLEEFEKEAEDREESQNQLNKELIVLQNNEMFKELEDAEDDIFKLRMHINENLHFKKALKKLNFNIEKNNIHISNVNQMYLKDFLKDPIRTLLKEGKELENFTSLLVQLRHTLEENRLNLKTETKEKTIEHINEIFETKNVQTDIEKLHELNEKKMAIEKRVSEEGLLSQLENLKNQISVNAVKLEHAQSDVDRKNKDYLRYLSSLKNEREDFQKSISEVINEDVKLNITFSF